MSELPQRYTILVVPDDGAGEVRQLRIDMQRVRALALGLGLAVGAVLAAGVYGLSTMGRLRDHEALMAENLALKESLFQVQQRLDEADLILQRVQHYDAQLRQLLVDHPLAAGQGPLEPDEDRALDVQDEPDVDLELEEDWYEPVEPFDPVPRAEDLRPVDAWVQALEARADDVVQRLERIEPRLGVLSDDLDDLGSIASAFPQIWPVDGVITSPFGYRRSPLNGRWKFHNGLDIYAPTGARVYAVAPGLVTFASWNTGYGNMVLIDHGFGITTKYGHNSRLFVQEGDWVDTGQTIATVGSTGMSTGPHCHFELHIDDQAVDPLEYLP